MEFPEENGFEELERLYQIIETRTKEHKDDYELSPKWEIDNELLSLSLEAQRLGRKLCGLIKSDLLNSDPETKQRGRQTCRSTLDQLASILSS